MTQSPFSPHYDSSNEPNPAHRRQELMEAILENPSPSQVITWGGERPPIRSEKEYLRELRQLEALTENTTELLELPASVYEVRLAQIRTLEERVHAYETAQLDLVAERLQGPPVIGMVLLMGLGGLALLLIVALML